MVSNIEAATEEVVKNSATNDSSDTGEVIEEVVVKNSESVSAPTNNGGELKIQVMEDVSTSQRGLLDQDDRPKGYRRPTLTILPPPSQVTFSASACHTPRSALPSPLQQLVQDKEKMSRTVPSSLSRRIRERLGVPSVRDISWTALKKMAREWIKNPTNMAFLVWCVFVAISGAILFMLMTGMLNHVMPNKSKRNAWTEVHNQILNALFTLMCLYQHPHLIYHLFLLCRWKPEDIKKLRKIYCKHGTYKPHEWAHMMVVVILLNLNCLGQYALCGMNLGFRRSERPAIGVGICTSLTTGPAAAAGVYSIMSPLGREYDTSDSDEESQVRVKSLQRRYSFSVRNDRKVVEENPRWRGGLFDIWDKIYVAYLSLFCSFCVFGWNMERLGFGNMYVHIATFLLFCVAPFWIFNLAAINIEDGGVREVLGFTGVVLCIFGLLYGGFWRIQIRKRYNLPPNNFFCGYPAVADCCQWLFCCWCSLAQEVRTRDFYDIAENKFCSKHANALQQSMLSPLPPEGGSFHFRSNGGTPYLGNSGPSSPAIISPIPSRFSKVFRSPDRQLLTVEEESPPKDDEIVLVLAPTVPLSIQRDEIQQRPFESENDYTSFRFR